MNLSPSRWFARLWGSGLVPSPHPPRRPVRVRFGDYRLDEERYELLDRDGQRVSLAKNAMELLILLVLKQGTLATRDEIEARLWDDHPPANINAGINNLIRGLRAALGDDPAAPRFVKSVPGRGYRFVAPLIFLGDDRASGVPRWWWATASVNAATLIVALTAGWFAFAIGTFLSGAVLLFVVQPFLPDTPAGRAGVSTYLIAAMAYIPSAWTLALLRPTVVNMETLQPATFYPMITGLKFIPLFILVLATWVVLGRDADPRLVARPMFRWTYLALGVLFLVLTSVALVVYSGDYRLWTAKVAGRWTLLTGYVLILALNVAIWLLGLRTFAPASIASYRQLTLAGTIAYVCLTPWAITVDAQYNLINRHYLDKRRSDVYVAANPRAIESPGQWADAKIQKQIGPDLNSLLSDPEFQQALRGGLFYKQDFDEPFQVFNRAVMFGYLNRRAAPSSAPTFTIVRFPEELARALRFERIADRD